jgi:MazG family protein
VATQKNVNTPASLAALRELIAALRSEQGCPWDRKQTPATLSVYLIEEVYELVEAIAAGDIAAICEELGDVIFQIFFVAYLFEQEGRLTLDAVVDQNVRKMIRRHPHVFGTDRAANAGEVKQRWREIKRREKGDAAGVLDSIPAGMPALMRAYRVSERAAGIGFDWDSLEAVLHQTEAEWAEFRAEAREKGSDTSQAALEFGDILFTLANVARWARIHPETALVAAINKFTIRFKSMEAAAAAQGRKLSDVPRDEMERMWAVAKKKTGPQAG